MKLFIVMWDNGLEYQHNRTDPIAVFHSDAGARAFATKANEEIQAWLAYVEPYHPFIPPPDYPKRVKVIDPVDRDGDKNQRYYVHEEQIPLDPVIT